MGVSRNWKTLHLPQYATLLVIGTTEKRPLIFGLMLLQTESFFHILQEAGPSFVTSVNLGYTSQMTPLGPACLPRLDTICADANLEFAYNFVYLPWTCLSWSQVFFSGIPQQSCFEIRGEKGSRLSTRCLSMIRTPRQAAMTASSMLRVEIQQKKA